MENEQSQLFDKLVKLYSNNGYYESNYKSILYTSRNKNLNKYSPELVDKQLKPLRTVVNRSVEFYVSKISSNMQVTSENQAIKDAIEQFFKWSNFPAIKPVSLRNMTLLGNVFFKVNANKSKVFVELVDPRYITELELDSRGYITEIRIDIPIEDNKTFTEYWNKAEGYFATWEHVGENLDLDALGTPTNMGYLAELGIDFIPVVQVKFKDVGDTWGLSCVNHALDKIDEANRQASRLSDLLFRYNKQTTVISSENKDSTGRPIPTPKLKEGEQLFGSTDESLLYLNNATISSLIPDINYDSALNILNAMMDEIKQDLPELNYYSMKESNTSGKALKMLLSSAIDRATEAQSNYIQGLVRVCEIALTLGSFWNLFTLGTTYENGYDFEIVVEDMFPMDDSDKAELLKNLTVAGLALETSLKMLGYDQEFITLALLEKQNQDKSAMDLSSQSLGTALNSFNQGG
jgi:hypothetical protein